MVAVREDDLVFAAREEAVEGWMRALDELGPVEVVEPGPVALARALESVGIRDGMVALDDRERGTGVIDLREGAVSGVRRLYGAIPELAKAFPTARRLRRDGTSCPPGPRSVPPSLAGREAVPLVPLPDVGSVPAEFLTAYGAALGGQQRLDQTLLPDHSASGS